jgi:hypothetical protein
MYRKSTYPIKHIGMVARLHRKRRKILMTARPDLNESDYGEPFVTSGSYPARLKDLDTSAVILNRVMLGNLGLASSSIPTIRIDLNTQRFLDKNALWPALDAAEKLRGDLERKAPVQMGVFVENDSEAQDREELVLSYSLQGIPYKEILRIWDYASRKLHDSLPASMAERVYVRLTKA